MNHIWWKECVIYQIYPRSFKDSNGDGIGDLEGIIEKLDYLMELGIDVIWLSPIYKSPNDDNGYDISGYQEIMDEFGNMEIFDRLLSEAHQRNIKIILDLVVNHSSDEHPWFVESRSSKDNPYRDFYIWKEGIDGKSPNRWDSYFGGPAWEYDERTDMYYLHLFSKKQPDLKWDNQEVRNTIYDMMTWWLDKGIDGFRMDVINLISKAKGYPEGELIPGTNYTDRAPFVVCGPHCHEYLKEMNDKVLSKYDIMTVGETPHITIEDAKRFTSEDEQELNMVFHFDLMDLENVNGSKWTDNRFDLVKLKECLSRWQIGLSEVGWNSLFWSNHDQPRAVSRYGSDDKYRVESAKMLGTCLHMMKGTPYIYQGEELGMTNVKFDTIDEYNDIETRNSYIKYTQELGFSNEEMMRYIHIRSRDNARAPMQWNDSIHAGFTTGTPWLKVNPNYTEINAQSQVKDEQSVFNYYKKLIQLRKKYEIIVYGDYELLLPESKTLFIYTRKLNNQVLLVICNFSDEQKTFKLPEDFSKGEPELLITNGNNVICNKEMVLMPYEARVYLYK